MLHVLPTLWFRNTWSWRDGEPRPRLARVAAAQPVVRAEHHQLGVFYLYAEPGAALLFCENETNTVRVFGAEAATRFPKDGIGDHVLHGTDTVNPAGEGTKAAVRVRLEVPAGGQAAVTVRLTREAPEHSRRAVRRHGRAHRPAAGRGGRVLRRHHAAGGER